MKKIIILFLLIINTCFANTDNINYLFKIKNQIYTLENFKIPKYSFEKNKYEKNVKIIKKFIKHKEIYEQIILNSKEYKDNKKEIEKKLLFYSKKIGRELFEIEKIDLTMFLWKEIKFKKYHIDEILLKKYYKYNIKNFQFPKSIKAMFLFCKTKEDFKKAKNALSFTFNKESMFIKLKKELKSNQKFLDLGWRDKKNINQTFLNKEIFDYLWKLEKGEVSKKEIYNKKYKKYLIFYIKDKKNKFTVSFNNAKNKIKIILKNKLFTKDIKKIQIKNYKPKWNPKYIKKISKK